VVTAGARFILLPAAPRVAAGWVVFDVPARHGQLVLRNADLHKVAVWTY
jgi:hypothetical protein